jgi:hypothetical protein
MITSKVVEDRDRWLRQMSAAELQAAIEDENRLARERGADAMREAARRRPSRPGWLTELVAGLRHWWSGGRS